MDNVAKLVQFRHEQNAAKRGRPETPADPAEDASKTTQHKTGMNFMYRTANTYYGPPRENTNPRIMNHGKTPKFATENGLGQSNWSNTDGKADWYRREFVLDNIDTTKSGISAERRLTDRSLSAHNHFRLNL
jgi:hypothetical protein